MGTITYIFLAASLVFTVKADFMVEAELLFLKGDWAGAATAYNKLVKEEPTEHNYVRLADAYFYGGRRTRSGELWQEAHERFDNVDTRVSVALFEAVRKKEADGLLGIVGDYGGNARLLRNIAFYYMYGKRNDDKALLYFSKAAAADPKDYVSYFYAGTIYENRFLYDEAIVQYKKSIAINPRFAQSLNNLGYNYKEMRFYTYAIDMYKKAIAEMPGVDSYHYNVGNAYLHKEMVPEAQAAYARALALNPKFAKAHYNMARTLMRQSRHTEAIGEFELYIKYWTPGLPRRDVPHPDRVKAEIIEIEDFIITEQEKRLEEERVRKSLQRRRRQK